LRKGGLRLATTSYKKIFNHFTKLITDRDIAVNLNNEDMTYLLDLFLTESKSIWFKNCKVDLSEKEEPLFLSENFVATGGVGNTFIISDYPNNPDPESIILICKINDVNTTDYTFNSNTKTFTITSDLVAGDEVTCGFEFIGQFNNILTDEEQIILAYGMIISWFSPHLFDTRKLKEIISSKDWNQPHSPANLLEKLEMLNNVAMKKIKQMTISYSYNDWTGFN
jgi:hypothetical protein